MPLSSAACIKPTINDAINTSRCAVGRRSRLALHCRVEAGDEDEMRS